MEWSYKFHWRYCGGTGGKVATPSRGLNVNNKALETYRNPGKEPVKIIEAQVGSILKETDIVRYEDVYGRVK